MVRTAWSIVADGTLFKGAYVLIADNEHEAIEKTKSLLGREGNAATVTIKAIGDDSIELGRSEYPADDAAKFSVPHVKAPMEFSSRQRFVFDLAARANVIAEDEDAATKKLGHALTGKDVGAVKFMRTAVTSQEPIDDLSSYERHLIEKQFRSVRVAST